MSTQQQLARAFAAANPKRDGGTWSGWCASLMYRYNQATIAYSTAMAAGDAIIEQLNKDHHSAPIGAIHYWAGVNGKGHVAQEILGSGELMFMASSKVTEMLGDAIGFISFDDYQRAANLPYRGWAMSYGLNPIVEADDNGNAFNEPVAVVELREVQGDGVRYYEPVNDLAVRIGNALIARGRVPAGFQNDGIPGTNWRIGVQKTVKQAGFYAGAVDGRLGTKSLKAVQKYAAKFGDYAGPIDGDPRSFSWEGFALGLERP